MFSLPHGTSSTFAILLGPVYFSFYKWVRGVLKSLYDDIISIVDDLFGQRDASTATPVNIGKLYYIQPNTSFYVNVLEEKWTCS